MLQRVYVFTKEAILFSIIGFFGFYSWKIIQSPLFQVKHIQLYGNQRVKNPQIFPREILNQNIFQVDLQQTVKSIQSHPWIHSIIAKREFPNTIKLFIQEEAPIAILADKDLYYVNDYGNIITAIKPGDALDYTILTGLQKENLEKIKKTIELLKRIRENGVILKSFRDEISELYFHPVDGYSVYLLEHGLKITIGFEVRRHAFRRLVRVYEDLVKKNLKVASLNLNFEDRVIVGLNQKQMEPR